MQGCVIFLKILYLWWSIECVVVCVKWCASRWTMILIKASMWVRGRKSRQDTSLDRTRIYICIPSIDRRVSRSIEGQYRPGALMILDAWTTTIFLSNVGHTTSALADSPRGVLTSLPSRGRARSSSHTDAAVPIKSAVFGNVSQDAPFLWFVLERNIHFKRFLHPPWTTQLTHACRSLDWNRVKEPCNGMDFHAHRYMRIGQQEFHVS